MAGVSKVPEEQLLPGRVALGLEDAGQAACHIAHKT